MIYKGSKEITVISIAKISFSAVYKGGRLVWEAIKSCFGKGHWINDKPWNNQNGWENK